MVFQFQPKQPSGRELNGGDLLAQSLKHLGAEHAFGIHGGHLDAFLLGAEEIGIKLIDTRHETVAVQAAEGYSKISGKVGVCFVTANSGFSNGLPGLASASADRSPIFCITSSPPLQDHETNALQGFHDQVNVSKPITKFSARITNPEEIPRIVAYAYRAANAGIKGPVLLDFPIDILFTPVEQHRIAYGALNVPPAFPPAPAPAALDALLKAWSTAQRPVIISGTGVRGTSQALTTLVETTNTPIFYSNKLSSPIPPSHPLRGGPATSLAALATSPSAPKPDFVLLLAARTGFLLGGRSGAIIPNDCVLAQVDLDGAEIGRTHAVQIGITSDAGEFLNSFLLHAATTTFPRNDEWTATCRGLATAVPPFATQPKVNPADGQVHPWHAFDAVMRALPKDSIISIDGGEAGQWAAMTAERAEPHACVNSTGYLGFLGNGWGYSLGAAVADPGRLVVNVQGDGSAGFHLQELDTCARFGVRVLTVVANNYVWGMSVNGQDLIYEGKTDIRPAVTLSKACAYEVVAQGMNCAGEKVTKYEEIAGVVDRLSRSGKPGLINMIVSVKPASPATLSMVNPTNDESIIVVPYYDNIPRPYYKKPQSNGTAA